MANAQIADRVRETTTTTGTSTITLAGAVPGHRTFSTAFTDGTVVYYCITNYVDWEVGYGTFTTAGNTLTRSYVLSSSNSNALVNFGAGTKEVINTAPKDLFSSFDSKMVLPKSVAGGTNVTLTTLEASNGTLILTGVLTASINLITPIIGRWTIVNTTTGGAWTITARTSSGTGIIIPRNTSRTVVADGVNVIDPESGLSSLYLGVGANAVGVTYNAVVTGSLGYAAGAGGTAPQQSGDITSLVTLNKKTGQFRCAYTAFTAGTTYSFTLNNSTITETDLLIIGMDDYRIIPFVQYPAINGQVYINLYCISSVTFAPYLKFAVVSGSFT